MVTRYCLWYFFLTYLHKHAHFVIRFKYQNIFLSPDDYDMFIFCFCKIFYMILHGNYLSMYVSHLFYGY